MVDPETAKWDGRDILGTFPGSWKDDDGIMSMTYDFHGKIIQPHREAGKDLKVLHITLPEGVFIQVNQWTNEREGYFINILVRMRPQPDQEGECGNFNGIAEDDDRLAIRKRMGGRSDVAQEDLIGFKTKTNIDSSFQGHPTISKCPSEILTAAHATCQAREHHFIPTMTCLVTECAKSPLVA